MSSDRDIVSQLEEGRQEPTGRCGTPHPKLRQPWGTPATCTLEADHRGPHRTVHLTYPSTRSSEDDVEWSS